jgi:hypothetical protein
MATHLELACTVCSEEFRVPVSMYASWGDAVGCPCCGSTDLIVLGATAPEVASRAS